MNKSPIKKQKQKHPLKKMKPENRTPEIASAKRRVKPLARLLRCATARRVTAPLGCVLKASGMAERFLSARPHGPKPQTPFSLVNSPSSDRPGAVKGREARRSRSLDGEDRSGIIQGEGKGGGGGNSRSSILGPGIGVGRRPF